MEFDACTSTLIASFLDIAGASCSLILSKVLEDDKSRGQAVEHLMATASLLDANLKLIRRQAAITCMELHPCSR